MSNVAIFRLGETPRYLRSVNTSDYENDKNVIINPDLLAVKEILIKYWKREGDKIVEMSVDEKRIIDEAELQVRKNQADTFEVDNELMIKGLIQIGNARWAMGQVVTKEEIINWIKIQIV